MTRRGQWYLSVLLWTWGGAIYFLMEVAYKILSGKPETISWTMLLLAAILCIPIERFGKKVPVSLPIQALICAIIITIAEFIAGIILNVWLGLGIWDYSTMPLNVEGQICLPFAILWYILCLIFIPLFDHVRGEIEFWAKWHK